ARSALRRWWEVTTSREYFAFSKRRLAFKAMVVSVIGILLAPVHLSAIIFDGGAMSWTEILYLFMNDVASPLCLVCIPYQSIWLDVFFGFWMMLGPPVQSGPCEPPFEYAVGPLWIMVSMCWMHSGGIHSAAIVPMLFSPLINWSVSENLCSGVSLAAFASVTMAVVVWIIVAEWQLADGFYRLQKSTEVIQLLLEEATSGLCTLSPKSGIVSEASSSFLENFGMHTEGASMLDFVAAVDREKVASLLRDRDALPLRPILGTFYKRPTLEGAPTSQFEAKLVPYAVCDEGVSVCLQKVGEERFVEAPAEHGGEAARASEAAYLLDPRSQPAPRAWSEHGTEFGTEVSLAYSKTTASARPLLEPEEPTASRREAAQRAHRAKRKVRVQLNNSMRQDAGFEETPQPMRIMRLMGAMEGINACGVGCCMLHVSVAAARQVLVVLGRKPCGSIELGSQQCPACFSLILCREVIEEGSDGNIDCPTCGNEVHPQRRSGSTLATSEEAPVARARWPGAATFKVTIDRSDGSKLGIDVDIVNCSTVLVEKVNEGLISMWNVRNPEQVVESGDRIVEVNGVSGLSKRILAQLGVCGLLDIVVLRRRPLGGEPQGNGCPLCLESE
ncbi:unnamed protein product, partial [Prorocentrum cordatum]